VDFSTGVRAFGFYATAYSTEATPTMDATSLVLYLERAGGVFEAIAINHTHLERPGSVFYFGVTSDDPFLAAYLRNASTTDPDARLFTKSRKVESILASMGHVLMENRSKLAVDTRLTHATGTTECEAALDMLAARADEARTTKHRGYAVSQVIRKLIETLFGDGKQHGGTIRQVKPRARTKLGMCSRWPCSLSICDACQRCLRRALVSPTLDRQERCARFAFRHANPAKSAKQGQSPAKASFTIITLENHHDSEYAFANQANFNELF